MTYMTIILLAALIMVAVGFPYGEVCRNEYQTGTQMLKCRQWANEHGDRK